MPRWVRSAPKLMRWGFVETTARVRWGECDGQGHAYYGSYVPWFDLGREAFAMAVGVDYRSFQILTTEFHVRYHSPAEYLDELVIRTWATTPTSRLDCYYEIYRKVGNELIAEGRSQHALVSSDKGLRMRAPDEFHRKFEEFLAARETSDDPSRAHVFSG